MEKNSWRIGLFGSSLPGSVLLLYHAATVFITSKFMGKEWESKQLENLKGKQEAKLAELAASIDTGSPSPDKGNRSNTVTMIAAAGANNELGKDNDLVWHLPVDFKRFKTLTTGHHIIMGRKTFESFPKTTSQSHTCSDN